MKRRYSMLLALGPLYLLAVLVRWPLLQARQLPNDYDHPAQTVNAAKEERRYVADRHPGSPLYEMLTAVAYHKIIAPLCGLREERWGVRYGPAIVVDPQDQHIVTDSRFVVWFKWISLAAGLLILGLFWSELQSVAPAPVAWLAALTLSLHPVFIWMSVAWSEDILAVALGYLAFHLARRRVSFWPIAILAAVAVGLKFTAVIFAWVTALRLAERFHRGWRDPAYWRTVAAFLAVVAGLSGLFYLPAFIYFKMNMAHWMESPLYGTTPVQRVMIGLLFLRTVFQLWIAVALFLAIRYGRRWISGDRSLESPWDPALVVVLFLCVIEYHRFSFAWLIAFGLCGALGLLSLVRIWKAGGIGSATTAANGFLVLSTLAIVCRAPFSRSFFLPLLPSLFFLGVQRFRSKAFWALSAGLMFLPMFHYYAFDFSKPKLYWYRDGFYACFLKPPTRWNEINDFGYKNNQTPSGHLP